MGSSSITHPNIETPTSTPQSSYEAVALRQQEAERDSSSKPRHSLNHNSVPVTGLAIVGSFVDGNTGEEGQEQATAAAAELASPNTKRSCKICERPGKLYTSCRMVAYYGVDYQRMDWKSHKGACKGKGRT